MVSLSPPRAHCEDKSRLELNTKNQIVILRILGSIRHQDGNWEDLLKTILDCLCFGKSRFFILNSSEMLN